MNGNYRAKLNSGRTVIARAHNKMIEIFGITVAEVDEQFRIKFLETFWEPDQMFRQLVSGGLEDLEGSQQLRESEMVEEVLAVGGDDACPVAHGAGVLSPH